MKAAIPMNHNRPDTLPSYPTIMNHHQPLSGPPSGYRRTPPLPQQQQPQPQHSGPPPALPVPVPHGSHEQSWRPPYPTHPYDPAVQRRHSNAVSQPPPPPPPPQHSQPPPPQGPPHPSHPHVAYHNPPPQPPQGRDLPQLPPGEPYNRPNSLPNSAPSHPLSEPHSPHTYRPPTGAPPDPTPHSAPPTDYGPPRVPYGGPGEVLPPGLTNGDHAGPPPGYMHAGPPHHIQPTQGAMYDGGMGSHPRQRKATRAQQACDQCRARKAKCDEGRPSCSHCKDNGIECKYKDIPPQKQEKSTQLLLDRISLFEEKMDNMRGEMSDMRQMVKALFNKSNITLPSNLLGASPKESVLSPGLSSDSKFVTPALHQVPKSYKNDSNSQLQTFKNVVEHAQSQPISRGSKGEMDDQYRVPQNHTTAAHKLLNWKSIKQLLDRDVHPDYVLRSERKRGLIRIYGCGEGRGHDTEYYSRQLENQHSPPRADSLVGHSSISGAAISPATHISTPQHDEELLQEAPSPNWGFGLPLPPDPRHAEYPGGLDASGNINTNPDVVRRLFQSYMDNMYILHPFMDATMLQNKVAIFIQQYAPQKISMRYTTGLNESRGTKRKRTGEHSQAAAPDMSPCPSSVTESWTANRIEHSVENAIVLMMLALGAICEHKTALPGFVPDPHERPRDKQEFAPSPEVQAVFDEILVPSLTPSTGMNSQAFNSPAVPSPDQSEWRTPIQRPQSRYGPDIREDSSLKNIDVIPGLAYYAYAAGILGEMQGGCELPFVQASILASFYAAQLAHPFQSHGWICQAARACAFLIREIDPKKIAPKIHREKNEKIENDDSPLVELCAFAYWTCLQHESDLLAELDMAASGISQSETEVGLPQGFLTNKDQTSYIMFYYYAQIHLRKLLNSVHHSLYDIGLVALNEPPMKVLEALSVMLDIWKQRLPPMMQWNENDPPSEDINVARLRAKYYGARYIIHRPILQQALQSKPVAPAKSELDKDTKQSASFKAYNYQAVAMARFTSEPGRRPESMDGGDLYDDTWAFENLDDSTRRACEQCISAAIQSTRAFHGIKGRPIVTNIFGTAHAQFGNMLVLSATYTSYLKPLIDREQLEDLLQRTIKFLAMYKDISPTLMADARILCGVYYKLFKKTPATSSFTTASFDDEMNTA